MTHTMYFQLAPSPLQHYTHNVLLASSIPTATLHTQCTSSQLHPHCNITHTMYFQLAPSPLRHYTHNLHQLPCVSFKMTLCSGNYLQNFSAANKTLEGFKWNTEAKVQKHFCLFSESEAFSCLQMTTLASLEKPLILLSKSIFIVCNASVHLGKKCSNLVRSDILWNDDCLNALRSFYP